jgi:organic hydroperoxide reductase OsmC/OhrA
VIPARRLEYGVELDSEWTASSDRGGRPLPADNRAWTPEHLLLLSLCRCTLMSLRHHAGKAGLSVASQGRAHGTVTRRRADGRYAFVELDVELGVALDPLPPPAAVRELLASAERDCFVGNSLTQPPAYRWRVNGEAVA